MYQDADRWEDVDLQFTLSKQLEKKTREAQKRVGEGPASQRDVSEKYGGVRIDAKEEPGIWSLELESPAQGDNKGLLCERDSKSYT